MSTLIELHSHKCIARLEQRVEHGEIGLSAGMRLDVGICTAEQFFRAADCQLFNLIDNIASAIVAVKRVAFSVFIGQHRTER